MLSSIFSRSFKSSNDAIFALENSFFNKNNAVDNASGKSTKINFNLGLFFF